jgi:calcineurin-like phosphoesterase family protein
LYTTEGNHDSRPSNGNGAAYLDAFSLPVNGASPAYPDHAERYYSFDYGRVHFVVLDTEFAFQDTVRRAEQLSWLESDLAASRQPWRIALFHRSPYSAGGEHGSDLAVRDAFGPLFEQYGVQLVVSGHEHDYERTLPTRASATGTAVTYIVTGGGGAPLYPAATGTWTAYSASRHHYVRADVTECTLSARAIGLDGSPFDSVTLNRCAPAPEAGEIVLYAAEATVAGRWVREIDAMAAGGARIRHPDGAAAKLTTALAQPVNYFELTFDADAGVPYRLWIRGKADRNYWGNDSVFVQFDNSVTASGAAQFRIGTAAATEINLEDCSGCGLSGWGWQDNGWGAGVMGPLIQFSRSGTQRVRVQTREDGLAIDQIVLSPGRYLNAAPGTLKNDSTILIRP